MIYIASLILFLAAMSEGQEPKIVDFTGCVTGDETLQLRCKHDVKNKVVKYEFSMKATYKAEEILNSTIRISGFTQVYKNTISIQDQEIWLTMLSPFTNDYNANYSCSIQTSSNNPVKKTKEFLNGQVVRCAGIGTFMFACSSAWLFGLILSLISLH